MNFWTEFGRRFESWDSELYGIRFWYRRCNNYITRCSPTFRFSRWFVCTRLPFCFEREKKYQSLNTKKKSISFNYIVYKHASNYLFTPATARRAIHIRIASITSVRDAYVLIDSRWAFKTSSIVGPNASSPTNGLPRTTISLRAKNAISTFPSSIIMNRLDGAESRTIRN